MCGGREEVCMKRCWVSWGWTRNWGRRLKAWGVRDGGQKANLLLQAYRACVLSSMGSPLVSCWPSASGGRVPFSVASLSERPRIRGNSMKSYSRAPMAPPIMGPTQYTWKDKEQNVFEFEEITFARFYSIKRFKDMIILPSGWQSSWPGQQGQRTLLGSFLLQCSTSKSKIERAVQG